MSKFSQTPRPHNHLLSLLSQSDFGLLKPKLESVVLPVRLALEIPNKPIAHICFPESGIVSVVAVNSGRHQTETGIIGWEGMTGSVVVLGDDRTPLSTYVQLAGHGQRIAVAPFRDALRKSETLRQTLMRFVQAFAIQAAHTALANGQAKVDERLARWILMGHDRSNGHDLPFTHEFLALMLGVRRAGVTQTLNALKERNLVATRRGLVVVLDRAGLETLANSFYGVPEAEYDRLIGWRRKHAVWAVHSARQGTKWRKSRKIVRNRTMIWAFTHFRAVFR